MERRSRLVIVGLAIVVAAFLYLVYVAWSTMRAPAGLPLQSGMGTAAAHTR